MAQRFQTVDYNLLIDYEIKLVDYNHHFKKLEQRLQRKYQIGFQRLRFNKTFVICLHLH